MAKTFLSEDFLLQTDRARQLYFDHAALMPIIDYHNHLPPDEIAVNKQFADITELWLKGDHYKWRAMRGNGINEELITGNATSFEKFKAWAETTPYTMRNPLYHWSHMELKKPFGITGLLNAESAESIYAKCNAQLSEYTTQALLKYFNVEALCTTDDPADELIYHKKISEQPFGIKVLPAFRPDKAMAVDDADAYNKYLQKLSCTSGIEINVYNDLLEALHKQHSIFHEAGCRISDHGLDTFTVIDDATYQSAAIFSKVIAGKTITTGEAAFFKMTTLHQVCKWNHEKGWVQQFHIGALRNNNTRLLKRIGADAGVDSMGDWPVAQGISAFFDKLDKDDKLAKTVIYNNNPMHNEVYATMTGNFQDGNIPGKIQYGSGWWFLDQKDGMEKQMNTLSNMGLLSRFIGMTTDSRSFLSFSRHEYFRRILCNLIGNDIENGELPGDMKWLGKMVEDICYYNAKDYFKL